jgi:hypothetical protein
LICGHVEFGTVGAQSLAGVHSLRATGCDARLDVARAVATVSRPNGRPLVARVLAHRNVACFDTTDTVTLAPCSANFLPASTRGTQRGVEWVHTQVPNDEDWPGMSFALAHTAQGSRHAVALVTSYELKKQNPRSGPLLRDERGNSVSSPSPAGGEDQGEGSSAVVGAAVQLAREVLGEDPASQIADHETAWRQFWSASGVALAEGYLEATWYRNLYFLRCCSKPGVPPIGLFMGCALDVMPWHGVATTDYNFVQAFWGVFAGNHAELAEPYNRFMVEYLPRGKWFARETYGLDGAFYPVNHFTHQLNDPADCKSKNRHMNFYLPWTYVPGANGWQAHNVWLAYLYQPEADYLKRMAYPLVKEMAIFYADFLEHCRRACAAEPARHARLGCG